MLALVLLVSMQVSTDVCPNIPGDQTAVPSGMVLIEGFCVPDQEAVVVMPPPGSVTAKKPTVELTTNRHVAIWSPVQPATFHLTVSIKNADEQFWCPGIQWVWPNGTMSSEEGDCPPYDKAPPKEIASKSWSKDVTLGPGRSTIVVNLVKAGNIINTKQITVVVMAGDNGE